MTRWWRVVRRWLGFRHETDYLPQGRALVEKIWTPDLMNKFAHLMWEDRNIRSRRRAYNWMVALAMRGYYYGYPECCIREFVLDFCDEDELSKRFTHGRVERVPCRECYKKLMPKKEAA